MSRQFRVRAAELLCGVGTLLAVSVPTPTLAQTPVCGVEVKQQVAAALAAAVDDTARSAVEKDLYARYQSCIAADAAQAPAAFFAAARECGATVSNLGSIFFEEMSCSGYDPQRRQFASPIKIKQVFGYGAAPLPGSREYVLHCVADAGGVLRAVGRDSVHLADALPGQPPTWQFATIVNANDSLQTIYPMNGATRVARSILSWGFRPTSCTYTPIWGNALNYRIRLNQ